MNTSVDHTQARPGWASAAAFERTGFDVVRLVDGGHLAHAATPALGDDRDIIWRGRHPDGHQASFDGAVLHWMAADGRSGHLLVDDPRFATMTRLGLPEAVPA